MKDLTKAQFEKLTEEQQREKLQELAEAIGEEIEVSEDADLVALYEEHTAPQEIAPTPTRGKKTKVTALDTVRFVDDDGKRRRLLKGETDSVGAKVAKQIKAEGLVS